MTGIEKKRCENAAERSENRKSAAKTQRKGMEEPMTYFNRDVYNYEAMEKESRKYIDGMRLVKEQILEYAKLDFEGKLARKGKDAPRSFERVMLEIRLEFLQELMDIYEAEELKTIVSIMESPEEWA